MFTQRICEDIDVSQLQSPRSAPSGEPTERPQLGAAQDYRVNLKSEIEIVALHKTLDQMRTNQLAALVEKQQEQIALLTRMLDIR